MAVLEFIIHNILTQAAVIIGLVACLGLVLQKKPASDVLMGTFKTCSASSFCLPAPRSCRLR